MEIPFVGPTYEARSLNFNAQRCINLFPEVSPDGKRVVALYGAPGLSQFANTSEASIRGVLSFDGVGYVVAGGNFYTLSTAGTLTLKGALLSSGSRVSMATNGTQVIVVDGTYGYTYTIASGAWAQITDADFPGADHVVFLDTYGIVNDPGTGEFWISANNDFTTWAALDFTTAESAPDDILSLKAVGGVLAVLGSGSLEWYSNTGNADFPFERIAGARIERGTAGKWASCVEDSSVFFLGDDGIVYRTEGYRPVRVSTHAIESAIAGYSDTSDAFMWSYTEEGHKFVVLTFPTGNATWVYDIATSLWHERASWALGEEAWGGRWRANCYMKLGAYHLVGDSESGKVWQMSASVYAEGSDPLIALRVSQHSSEDQKLMFFHRFELMAETGVGLASGQGSDPIVLLDWSEDGGHTFNQVRRLSLGAIGQYRARATANRLGSSRDRCWRVRISDPVKRVLLGARVDATLGAH